jgi:hypothetical protein
VHQPCSGCACCWHVMPVLLHTPGSLAPGSWLLESLPGPSLPATSHYPACTATRARNTMVTLTPAALITHQPSCRPTTPLPLKAPSRCPPGSDIDFKVIRGIGKVGPQGQQLSLWSNFTQYGLEHPVGLLRMDVHNPPFRSNLEGWLGAIIGDPPYGVRAGAKKVVYVPHALVSGWGAGGGAGAMARLLTTQPTCCLATSSHI